MVIVHQPTKTPPIGFNAQPKHQKQEYGWLHCQRHTSWGNFRVFTFSSSNMHKDLHRASQLQGSPSVCRAVAGKHCNVCFAYQPAQRWQRSYLMNAEHFKSKNELCVCGQHLWPQGWRSIRTQKKRRLNPCRPSLPIIWVAGLMCVILCVCKMFGLLLDKWSGWGDYSI